MQVAERAAEGRRAMEIWVPKLEAAFSSNSSPSQSLGSHAQDLRRLLVRGLGGCGVGFRVEGLGFRV